MRAGGTITMKRPIFQPPRAKGSETPTLGIPKLLATLHLEKRTEPLPSKVELSLKTFLKQHVPSVSSFIHDAIIEKLEREAYGDNGGSS
jgi:hypothetical protein